MRDGVSSNNLGDYFPFLEIVAQIRLAFACYPGTDTITLLSSFREASMSLKQSGNRQSASRWMEEEVQRKIDRLVVPRTKSVKTVLVYDGVLAPELEEDGFFDFLVPADRLLGR